MTDLLTQDVVPPVQNLAYRARLAATRELLIAEYERDRLALGIEWGCCFCGCGAKTRIAKQSNFCRERPVAILGHPARYCYKHWNSPHIPLRERFYAHVDKTPGLGPNGDCWLWTGNRGVQGYGKISINGSHLRANRLAWMVEHPDIPIPKGMMACHRCDNPPCVRIDHLFLGTVVDNAEDMIEKKRHKYGVSHHSAKITDDSVREIRRRRAAGEKLIPIARDFGLSITTVSYIAKRKIWKHVA